MFNAGILAAAVSKVIRGEQIYQGSNTSGNWICPAGVTSVCAVLIGCGGQGVIGSVASARSSGGGGALVYNNNIPVTPGTSYPYTIDASGTVMFGMTAGAGSAAINGTGTPQPGGVASTAGSPTARFNGGAGAVAFAGGSDYLDGGSSARYNANGSAGGGRGNGLYGEDISGFYGVGGTNNTVGQPYSGGGAIRIMWGPGRSFPYSAA